jgi:hypothetical protein
MGKPRKRTPEEQADFDRRTVEYREMLQRRLEVDARLRSERDARDRQSQDP